ncbi:MAG: abhydrolase domain-containing 18 [Vicinamibacterales bacterium]
MITRVFHRWERRLAAVAENRTVRPFEWGLEWLDGIPGGPAIDRSGVPADVLRRWSAEAVSRSEEFYAAPETAYTLKGDILTYRSAVETPHETNNTVLARYFPEPSPRGRKRAVVVLPQWNAEPGGHVGLCRLLNRFRISALRLTMPYHESRMPPELRRADYIVSANIGRTIAVCRQAVIDARQAIAWLRQQGYESIGILGSSLGSCLSMLTAAHEPLLEAAALNHVSPYFADVIWRGLSTEHVRASLDENVSLDALREMWMPISPVPFLRGVQGKSVLLVYALYDLSFPVDLSRLLVTEFRMRNIPHETRALPCGHYSSARMPFNLIDGLTMCRFLDRTLRAGR